MKKHIKLEWVYIAVLVISLILSIVTGVQIAGEVVNVRRNLSEQNMGMNAFVYGKYIDSYLTNRVELLNTMADCIAQPAATKNLPAVEQHTQKIPLFCNQSYNSF